MSILAQTLCKVSEDEEQVLPVVPYCNGQPVSGDAQSRCQVPEGCHKVNLPRQPLGLSTVLAGLQREQIYKTVGWIHFFLSISNVRINSHFILLGIKSYRFGLT